MRKMIDDITGLEFKYDIQDVYEKGSHVNILPLGKDMTFGDAQKAFKMLREEHDIISFNEGYFKYK